MIGSSCTPTGEMLAGVTSSKGRLGLFASIGDGLLSFDERPAYFFDVGVGVLRDMATCCTLQQRQLRQIDRYEIEKTCF